MEEKLFSHRLTEERKRLGYEKALHFSDALGLNASTYSRWEAGQGTPKAEDLVHMVEMGMDSHYLLTGARAGGYALPGENQVRIKVMEDEPSAGYGALTAAAFAMVTAIGAAISLWGAAPMTIWPPVLLFTILWACLLLCDAVYKLYRVVSVLDIT